MDAFGERNAVEGVPERAGEDTIVAASREEAIRRNAVAAGGVAARRIRVRKDDEISERALGHLRAEAVITRQAYTRVVRAEHALQISHQIEPRALE